MVWDFRACGVELMAISVYDRFVLGCLGQDFPGAPNRPMYELCVGFSLGSRYCSYIWSLRM